MPSRPYVLLSAAMSLDGYLDDATDKRLLLSNDADFDRVDDVRASCDALLVGATTVRKDNPRLLVRSADRRRARVERGLHESPIKVTLSATGDLDPAAAFFTAGDVDKIVYTPSGNVDKLRQRLGGVASVVDAGDPLDLGSVLDDLHARGVERLMVEGGSRMHTQFLTAGCADELHLVVAPFFVGDSRAPRFVGDGQFPWTTGHRATLRESRSIDGVALLRIALSDRCEA